MSDFPPLWLWLAALGALVFLALLARWCDRKAWYYRGHLAGLHAVWGVEEGDEYEDPPDDDHRCRGEWNRGYCDGVKRAKELTVDDDERNPL